MNKTLEQLENALKTYNEYWKTNFKPEEYDDEKGILYSDSGQLMIHDPTGIGIGFFREDSSWKKFNRSKKFKQKNAEIMKKNFCEGF